MTLEQTSQTSFLRTQDACRDILAVQDTTVTRSSGVGGDYLHATIAVDAQDKESHRWLAATERAGRLQGPRASRWWPIGRPMFST